MLLKETRRDLDYIQILDVSMYIHVLITAQFTNLSLKKAAPIKHCYIYRKDTKYEKYI